MYALKNCDTYLFIWNSFLNDLSDLPLLKKFGKKIIVMFVGSDIVWHKAQNMELVSFGCSPIEFSDRQLHRVGNLNDRLHYIRYAEKYSDLILSGHMVSQLLLKPYLRIRSFIPVDNIRYNPIQRPVPLVIFSPTDRVYKGYNYVIDVIQRAKSNGINFNFQFVENLPYDEALKLYYTADILIGELFYPGGGKQQREALASGTVVLTNNNSNYRALHSDAIPTPPFIHVDKDCLYDTFVQVVNDLQLRLKYSSLGRRYAEEQNNPTLTAKEIISAANNDFSLRKPTFLSEHLSELDETEIKLIRQWDAFVHKCDWYQEY